MSSSVTIQAQVLARAVSVSEDALTVELTDGRTITVPLGWFPRLAHATSRERSEWRLIGNGQGIHWPALDEDIHVPSLLSGRKSAESAESLERWLSGRRP